MIHSIRIEKSCNPKCAIEQKIEHFPHYQKTNGVAVCAHLNKKKDIKYSSVIFFHAFNDISTADINTHINVTGCSCVVLTIQ